MALPASEPTSGSTAVKALWWLQRGSWDRAHALVQEETPDNNWVHAHLHRVEGDLDNAGYWYRRAERDVCQSDLATEFAAIVSELTGA